MPIPDDDTLAQALARVARADFEKWQAQVRSAGHCAQPVRLRGRVAAVDHDTGEAKVAFSTTNQPDGVLLKACGSRRATRCESCSVIYKGDARQLVAAGLIGGKGIDTSVATHPMVFATFTAPSFGAVHSAVRSTDGAAVTKPCRHHRTGLCAHGNPLACNAHHDPHDELVGSPLCPECYDYEGAVIWNARCSELWRRTTIAISRGLAGQIGVPVRQLRAHLRISFVKVIEFQHRGVVHLHAVVRLDSPQGGCPQVQVTDLAVAVSLAATKVRAPNPWRAEEPIRWGDQLDVSPVALDGHRTVANYLAKYATKSTDDAGALDHRLASGDVSRLELSEHYQRLVATAWRLGGEKDLEFLRLRYWAHTLGFRGHWLTKARSWSTTFAALREARHDYRLAQVRGPAPTDPWGRPMADGASKEVGDWTYAGIGYSTAGDAWLASSARARATENHRLAWEERSCTE